MQKKFNEYDVIILMTRAFNAGFNKYESVDAGLEGRETDLEVSCILEKYKREYNDIVADLKKYFETTPRDKVLENWAKSESFDEIGPTMDEFLQVTMNSLK